MMITLMIFALGAAVIYGGFRIVLGWTAPASTVARFDQGTTAATNVAGKLVLVILALAVVAFLVMMARA